MHITMRENLFDLFFMLFQQLFRHIATRIHFRERAGAISSWTILGCGAVCVIAIAVFVNRSPGVITVRGTSSTSTSSTPSTTVSVSSSSVMGGSSTVTSPLIWNQESLTSLTPVDTAAYDAKLLQIANIKVKPRKVSTSTATSTLDASSSPVATTTPITVRGPWPVKTGYPNAGALLPFKRIVAYYGNLYSRQMGVLGEYPEDTMLAMLASTTAQWQAADPSTPVVPALDYIVTTAQASPGADHKYRLEMPDSETDKVMAMAAKINGLVFLDVQDGTSDLQHELPALDKYLKLPNVELSIDPEFSMKDGARPGTEIGTMDASDVNFAAQYLANFVRANNLPPKILVVHRFTQAMLTNYRKIQPLPEVQIVIDMDGFGSVARKIHTYADVIVAEPMQFTGFKLFYKNDSNADHMMSPEEVLKLSPQPSYIQYQ